MKTSKMQEIKDLGPWYQEFKIGGRLTTKRPLFSEADFAIIRTLIPRGMEGKKMVDLGCNAGLVSFKLKDAFDAEVIAVENNPKYLAQAHFLLNMEECGFPKINLVEMDIEEFKIPADVDLVFALSVLYHLKNPKEMIRRLCEGKYSVIAGFRISLYDKYIKMFTKKKVREVTYAHGKKKAALFV
jgi:tRNA (mo5U34)-methyltransferase